MIHNSSALLKNSSILNIIQSAFKYGDNAYELVFWKKEKTNPLSKSRAPMTRKEKLLKLAQSDAYYSVSLTRCGCKASSKLISQCFPFENAPSLPLPDCTAAKCTCEYLGLINRRRIQRRVTVRRASIRMGSDRRCTGRRKKEGLWNQYSI